MTTTTLSSNKSSEKLFDRKLFSMMAGCLRQNGILMAMYTVGLLLVTVLPTFYNLRQYTPVNPSESQLFTDSFFYAVTGIIVPVLLAAILFHYLHNRLSVDFYHSMPVSRNKLLPPDLYCDALLCLPWIFLHWLDHQLPADRSTDLDYPASDRFHLFLHDCGYLLQRGRKHYLLHCHQRLPNRNRVHLF